MEIPILLLGNLIDDFKKTNISKIKKNDLVNIEIDILSKYVKKYFHDKK